jgi:dCMP deaminase
MHPESRPSWDEYFLLIACNVSLRSEDPDIKHGAVIVNQYNHIIGTGYNGPIKGSDNSVIPFSVRDEKRKWMIHAEENAMLNVTQSSSERGLQCRLYVTGLPCNNCLQRMVNFGIRNIVMIDRIGSITENSVAEEMRNQIVSMSGMEVRKVPISSPWLSGFFSLYDYNIGCRSGLI